MIRISLIVAIIAGLAIAALNFAKVQNDIKALVGDRDHEKTLKEQTIAELKATNKVLVATTKELNSTKEQLTNVTKERDDAVAQVDDLTKKNGTLTESLKKTQGERDSARDELAGWKSLGIPLENIKATLASLKTVTESRDALAQENKILNRKIVFLSAQLDELRDPERVNGPEMPAGLRGKVLVADPKFDFVVLNIGEKQSVVPYGRFLVSRNGHLIAKLKVQSVQPDRSIANVMPGWNLSEVQEGDEVFY
jgi:hypothetical protein